jgi:endoglucanase
MHKMRNYIFLIAFISTCLLNSSCNSHKTGSNNLKHCENIRLNQLGYLPGGVKKAVIVNSVSSDFKILDSTGNIAFSGKLINKGVWEAAGDTVKIADFSSLMKNGKYRITVEDLGSSYPFEIRNDVYDKVFNASVKAFYLQRASTAIEEKYAGIFSHPMAHPDTNCLFHPSSGKKGGSLSSPKGWYDAGDYNKYIVNGGYTVSMLLTLYEHCPKVTSDNTNIPESGNHVSDLLDEIKWELDWAETMQDKDGGVFFKLTSKRFCGFVKPQDDNLERYVVGKSTTSTLNFAAMLAQAARVWQLFDPALSGKYLNEAKRAWDWAVKNPAVVFKNPPDISTGEYGHSDFKGDFFWAASELYVSTGDKAYKDYIDKNPVDFTYISGENWRTYLKNLGYFALVLPDCKLEASDKENYKKAILADADKQLDNLENCPYRQPLNSFVWGSNSDIADLAIIFANAYRISNDKKYLDAAIETTDYIFGKNAIGISFVTGFGSKPAMNPHFRLGASFGTPGSIPGWLVGGPNANLNDERTIKNPIGIVYNSHDPAKCYMDLTGCYASNEIAINWNAALAYITGFLVSYSSGK